MKSESVNRFLNLAIVIAVKDGAATIGKCLDSISEPLANGAVLYVFDSLSTDGTREIVLSKFPDARYTFGRDGGLYFAWNSAVENVSEPYIFFINSDDTLYSSDNLWILLDELRTGNQLVAASGKTIMTRRDGVRRFAGKPIHKDLFFCDMPVVTPATIFSVVSLRGIGGFNTTYKISADYDLVLRLLMQHKQKSFLFHDLTIARFALDGMSNKHRSEAFREIRAIINDHLSLWQMVQHALWFGLNEGKRVLLSSYFALRKLR